MIPKYLRFQSFASYKHEQVIDFEKLSRNEIFLIHGKTGSGKTSILDAITYVLYGESSGGSRGGLESMRCRNYGANSIPTEIEFIFEVKGKQYKFVRRVYDRVKRTGKVETESEYNCYYFEDGQFIPFFDNPTKTKVNEKAVEIIGLTYNQFMQVVILPQGKFESFLVASSKEKEEILNTLFQIEDWNAIGQWIYEKALEMDRNNKEQRSILNANLLQVGTDNRQDAENIISDLAEKEKVYKEQLNQINDKIEVLKSQLEKENELEKLFVQREETNKKHEELLASAQDIEAKEKKLKLNQQAKAIVPIFERYSTYKLESEELAKEKVILSDNLSKLESELLSIEEKLKGFEEQSFEIQAMRERLAVLKTLEKHYSQHEQAKNEVEKYKSDALNISKKLSDLTEKYNKITQLRNEKNLLREEIISKYQSNIQKLSDEKTSFETSKKLSDEISQYTARLEKLLQSLETLNNDISQKEKQISGKKAEQKEKYSLHISFLSQNIAQELREGEPCPVCGSVHHPSPSKGGAGKSFEEDLKILADDILKLENELAELLKMQSEFKSKIETGRTLINEKKDNLKNFKPFDSAEYEKVSSEYKIAQENIDKLPQINNELSDIEKSLATLNDELSRLQNENNSIQQKFSESGARLKVIEEQLDKNIPDLNSLNNEINLLNKRITDFEVGKEEVKKAVEACKQKIVSQKTKLEQNKSQAEKCQKNLQEAQEKLNAELIKNGFEKVEDFNNSRLGESEEKQLSDECNSYKIDKALYEKEISKLDTILKDKVRPNVLEIREKLVEQENEKEALSKEVTLNSEKLKRFKGILAEYDKKEAELSVKIEEARRLKIFGQELRGDRGIGLRRYVLGIMLENVIFEANRLLERVKGGQFRLYNVLAETENKQTGLDLMIGSNKAESKYSVAALSGGEKFLVAISLSMALSSVVQMQAGGVSIEAMFIDEGFGSLDPTALDEAMEILQSMKGSRKFLGIISHVESMKESIPNKIEVINDNEGSHIKISC